MQKIAAATCSEALKQTLVVDVRAPPAGQQQ